jgi:hypothetical protein
MLPERHNKTGISRVFARMLRSIAILSIGAIAGGFGCVWYGQQCIRVGQHIASLESENMRLARRKALLHGKIASLHAPKHLQLCASTNLEPPQMERLIVVSLGEMRNANGRIAYASQLEGAQKLISSDQ